MQYPHKHAEVIKAAAEGKAVEYKTLWSTHWVPMTERTNPFSDPALEWRIKPEPKPDVVMYQFIPKRPQTYTRQWPNLETLRQIIGTDRLNSLGILKIVYCGETGIPKDAQIVEVWT